MNTSKLKFIVLLLLAVLFLTLTASADVGVQNLAATNSIAANATTTANMGNAAKIDYTDSASVTLKYQGNGASTAAITVKWVRSMDATNYETAPFITNTFALNGTTAVIASTNFAPDSLRGYAYIKLFSIQNADASVAATNFSAYVSTKLVKAAK